MSELQRHDLLQTTRSVGRSNPVGKALAILSTTTLAVFLFLGVALSVGQQQGVIQGKVVSIADGDTLIVLDNQNQRKKVRLYAIDCPEKGQAHGTKAREFMGKLAHGQAVTVVVHDRDKYERYVGEVILPGGRHLNKEMVAEGYAWHYRHFSKIPQLKQELDRLEADAQKSQKGLWADKNPIPPWEFRKGNDGKRSSSTKPGKEPARPNAPPGASDKKSTEGKLRPSTVKIVAVLPNPDGEDEEKEWVEIRNDSEKAIDLTGWHLRDRAGHTCPLQGILEARKVLRVNLKARQLPLNNDGDDVELLDAKGTVQHKVTYTRSQAFSGNVVKFD